MKKKLIIVFAVIEMILLLIPVKKVYGDALQRCKIDAPLLAAGLLT